MGKLAPQERWRRHILERIKALKLSEEHKPLRKRGLAALGRKRLYTAEEWHHGFWERGTSPQYLEWYEECKTLADRFGLAPWVVSMLCLLRRYRPERDLGAIVMEAEWPRIRVVTESADPLFLQRLALEAQRVGLFLVRKQGAFETTVVNLDPQQPKAGPLPASNRPPVDVAFYIRVETPPNYPPEAASQLQKEASQMGRELQRRLGYATRQRLRSSPLVSMAEALKVDKAPLPNGANYEIIDKAYNDDDWGKDQERRRQIKSRRHKLRKRLVEPYQDETGPAQ